MFFLCCVKCTGTSSIATLLNHIYLSCGQKIHIQNMVTSIQYYKNIDSFLLYYILYDLDNYTISSCCTYCVVYSSNWHCNYMNIIRILQIIWCFHVSVEKKCNQNTKIDISFNISNHEHQFLINYNFFDINLPTAASYLIRCKHLVFYSVSQNKNNQYIHMNIFVWHSSLRDVSLFIWITI